MGRIRELDGLTSGNTKFVPLSGGCAASSCMTVSITGFVVFCPLDAGADSESVTEPTKFSKT